MTPAPVIVAVSQCRPPVVSDGETHVAMVSFEYGAILVTGARLLWQHDTECYRLSLPQASRAARIVIRDKEARFVLAAAAAASYHGLIRRPADPPVAKAQSETEN